MGKSFIIGGLFIVIFICLIPLPRKLTEYKTQKNGQLVAVTITRIHNCFKGESRIDFKYEGEKFDRRIACRLADNYKAGNIINVKHIAGATIFLFENENIIPELVSFGLLFLFGVVIIIKGFRQNRNLSVSNKQFNCY